MVEGYAPCSDQINQDIANLLDSLGIGQKQIDAATSSVSPDNVASVVTDALSSLSTVDVSGALTNFSSGTRTYLSVATIFGGIVAGDLMLLVIVGYSVINFVIQSIIRSKFGGDPVNPGNDGHLLVDGHLDVDHRPARCAAGSAVDPVDPVDQGILVDLDPSTRWIGTLLGSTTPTNGPA